MWAKRFIIALTLSATAISLAACNSNSKPPEPTIVPFPSTTITTEALPGKGSGNSPTPGTQAVHRCSMSQRSKDRTCLGPKRPGFSTIGKLAFQSTVPTITFTGTPETARMDGYLTAVTKDLAAFWTQAYQAAGIKDDTGQYASSYVKFSWIWPGKAIASCNPAELTTVGTMSYCFNSDNPNGYDRIFVAMDAILADWNGTPLPGDTRPHPKTGEWSAIYSLAHEYGHNLQEELGIHPALKTKQVELMADCLAGVYMRGSLDLSIKNNLQGFIQVVQNAHFSGDYEVGGDDHHGTPWERVEAVRAGIASASPAQCQKTYEVVTP